MIGKAISPILNEMEESLWEYEVAQLGAPNFTDDGFKSSIKIFMSAMMDKMWRLQEFETMSLEDRCNMAKSLGEKIRSIVKQYTNIDTHTLYVLNSDQNAQECDATGAK